ncbi:MAG: hypothetical protein U9R51_05075 [Actinomycetota bacterium]|nr:hypothetical protein [Actinomycetota bacterium]
MYASSPDQSLLWWAVQHGWGAEGIDLETTTASHLATPAGGLSRRLDVAARTAPRRVAYTQRTAG